MNSTARNPHRAFVRGPRVAQRATRSEGPAGAPTATPAQARRFVRAHTRIGAPAACPEIRLHLVDALMPLWEATAPRLEALGLDVPFWAVAWPGGQALARYVLDHPASVRGRRVLDLGCGSGVAAIAAALAGAARVHGADTDPVALAALVLNARLNAVRVRPLGGDPLDACPPGAGTVVLAADLWYEQALARRASAWLHSAAAAGATVLLADPERRYFPFSRARRLARYRLATDGDLERCAFTDTGVWRLGAAPAGGVAG